jgi:hypothetical protein
MRKLVASILVLASAALADLAMAAGTTGERASTAIVTDLSSQSASQRARTRIRVTPMQRTGKLVRECDFRLVREVSARGSYIVPRERCWWARQR